MEDAKALELERLEALLASIEGQKVMDTQPLGGTVHLTIEGDLGFQLNSQDDPQFLVFGDKITLVFQIKDVITVKGINGLCPSIILKKRVDNSEQIA